jgi:histidinol-phosphate aminotransferase
MLANPSLRPGILEITPYKAGDAIIPGIDRPIKLASNESALGPSERVRDAIAHGLSGFERYPDPLSTELRVAIARQHSLEANEILVGSGSEQLLHLLARAYAKDGDEIVQSQYGFLVYRIAALSVGATVVSAPEQNLTVDVNALLSHVTERTKIVFVANPGNPTGTWLPLKELRRLRSLLPRSVLLVLDGAYAEYMRNVTEYDPGHVLVAESTAAGTNNVVVTRTFSKIYGLAALRLGWLHGPTVVIDALLRFKEVFNVSEIAQKAGLAAIEDQDHVERTRAYNNAERHWLSSALKAVGLNPVPSEANFILAGFETAESAASADEALRLRGIIVRPVIGYGLPEYLRITVGMCDENRAAIAALKQWATSSN